MCTVVRLHCNNMRGVDAGKCVNLGPAWAERFFLNPEIWNICSALFMQDMPFLAMRMYVIIERNVINHMLLFFTLKNFIMFCLEIYRILVIALEEDDDEEDDDSLDIARG